MKQELNTILRFLDEHNDKILDIQEVILRLDASQPEALENQIEYLCNLIGRNKFENYDYLGYCYFFLGCIYYERGEYSNVILCLQYANPEVWESHIDKALAYWLLGINHSELGEHDKAQEELKVARDGLLVNTRTNSYDSQLQEKRKSVIRGRINEALVSLQTSALNWNKAFSDVISNLQIPEWDNDGFLKEWKASIAIMKPYQPHIPKQIENLMSILQQKSTDSPTERPFIHIFLAHCYNLSYFSENQETLLLATDHAENAVVGFSDNELNQALAHWYIAVLYFNQSNTDSCKYHLEKADELLASFLKAIKYTSPDFYMEIQNVRENLKPWINMFKRADRLAHYVSQPIIQKKQKTPNFIEKIKKTLGASPDTSHPERTPYEQPSEKKGENPSQAESDKTLKDSQPTPAPPVKSPLTVNITIPVDISALENLQPNSDNLTPDLYKKLQNFNRQVGNNLHESPPAPEDKSEIYIPSFQIFGQVTAGAQGEPYIKPDHPEYADKVDKSLKIVFKGKEHKVKFMNNIRHSFADGKKYGWLSVKGKSMNNATGNPINDKDYVLFCENHNAESCNGKVVVAFLPEIDDQLLTVKRLIELSADTLFRKNGYSSKIKFILQSESLLKNDPETGMSYETDLEIKNDHQLVGEVIAIAHLV